MLSLGHVSRVMWALARMDYRPPPALMRLLLARAFVTLPRSVLIGGVISRVAVEVNMG